MRVVLDASITLSWFFKDQRIAKSISVLRYVKENGALVPPLWNVEVSNVLVRYERRKIVTEDRTAAIFAYLRSLPITVETGSDYPSFGTITYARALRLSAYDASYLDLAIRFGLKLATIDGGLEAAARSLGASWAPVARHRRKSHRPT